MMNSKRLLRWLPVLAAAGLAFVQIQCLLIPDDVDTGDQVVNQRPVVRITSGASTDAPAGVDYKVRFKWNGVDDDGVVDHFQFAVDDTISETAWQDTTGFSAVINFEAATEVEGGDGGTFTDWHTFFIRAIDNEFGVSEPDQRFFNARTIAPTSEITFPATNSSELQRTVIINWEGEDLDSSRPDKKPVAWEYKLCRIRQIFDPVDQILDSLSVGDNLLLDSLSVGSKAGWVRVAGEETSLKLEGLPGEENLAFAVRAVDEAGAIEPSIEKGRNLLAFGVRNSPGILFVQVTDTALGTYEFPGGGGVDDIWEVFVPTDRELRFRWTGDASGYGSLPGNVNYALDIPDVEDDTLRDPQGIGGWIGWGTWAETNQPISFGPEEGGTVHNFYVKMRDISDSGESERLCHIRINVVPFTFENFALFVDDAKFQIRPPSDAQHDAFLQETIGRHFYELGDVTQLALYPPSGRADERPNAIDVSLELFATYQHVAWSSQIGTGSGAQPLFNLETLDKKLSSYSAAGGRVFLMGGRLSGFFQSRLGNFRYPKQSPILDEGNADFLIESYLWQFMKYRNTLVSVPTDASSTHQQASGVVGLRSQIPVFPDMEIDLDKIDPFEIINNGLQFRGGIKDWEGVQGVERPVLQIAGLDSIYTPVTMDTTLCCGHRGAGFDDAIVAQRYESTASDTANGTQQGRIVIFDFQPYWFQRDNLTDAGTAAINWLVKGSDH